MCVVVLDIISEVSGWFIYWVLGVGLSVGFFVFGLSLDYFFALSSSSVISSSAAESSHLLKPLNRFFFSNTAIFCFSISTLPFRLFLF